MVGWCEPCQGEGRAASPPRVRRWRGPGGGDVAPVATRQETGGLGRPLCCCQCCSAYHSPAYCCQNLIALSSGWRGSLRRPHHCPSRSVDHTKREACLQPNPHCIHIHPLSTPKAPPPHVAALARHTAKKGRKPDQGQFSPACAEGGQQQAQRSPAARWRRGRRGCCWRAPLSMGCSVPSCKRTGLLPTSGGGGADVGDDHPTLLGVVPRGRRSPRPDAPLLCLCVVATPLGPAGICRSRCAAGVTCWCRWWCCCCTWRPRRRPWSAGARAMGWQSVGLEGGGAGHWRAAVAGHCKAGSSSSTRHTTRACVARGSARRRRPVGRCETVPSLTTRCRQALPHVPLWAGGRGMFGAGTAACERDRARGAARSTQHDRGRPYYVQHLRTA